MNGKIIIAALALVIIGAAAFLVTRTGSEQAAAPVEEAGQVQANAPAARPAAPAAGGTERPAAANEKSAPAPGDNLTRQRIEMLTAALKFAAERKDAAPSGTAPAGSPAAAEVAQPGAVQPGVDNTAATEGAASAPGTAGRGYRGPVPTGVAGAPTFRNPQAPTQAEMAEATANMENTDRELAMLMGKFMGDPEKMQQMTTYFDELSADNPNMTKAEILEALQNAPFNQ